MEGEHWVPPRAVSATPATSMVRITTLRGPGMTPLCFSGCAVRCSSVSTCMQSPHRKLPVLGDSQARNGGDQGISNAHSTPGSCSPSKDFRVGESQNRLPSWSEIELVSSAPHLGHLRTVPLRATVHKSSWGETSPFTQGPEGLSGAEGTRRESQCAFSCDPNSLRTEGCAAGVSRCRSPGPRLGSPR